MDDLAFLASRLRTTGLGAGLDAVGIAPADPFRSTEARLHDRKAAGLAADMQFTYRNPRRSTDPSTTVDGAKAIVVGARSYRRTPNRARQEPVPAPVASVARYSWIDHYAPLRVALEAVADELRAAGWTARVLADDNALVDREAAFRAGMGWYGKNTMLLLHGRGSEFVLGSVVTDAPLAATGAADGLFVNDDPAGAAAAGCGPCTRCLPACPTGALVEPGVLDARRCLAWLLQAEGVFPAEHRVALGARIYGCDDCQDACPPNRVEIRRRPPPPAEPDAEVIVDLLALLTEDDDEELMARHGRWYVPRRQARYLRRNALIALGNVADGRDHRVAGALMRCLDHDDPLVRGHAVWAASRLGRADLLGGLLADEHDPTVRAELGALPAPRQA